MRAIDKHTRTERQIDTERETDAGKMCRLIRT